MAKHCVNHPRQKAVALCMGCGKHFCEACATNVKGVAYCAKCLEDVGSEFAKLKDRHDIDSSLPGAIHHEEPKKEAQPPKTVQPSPVSHGGTSAKVSSHGVPLRGIVAGIGKRIVARLVDLVFFLGVMGGGGGALGFVLAGELGMSEADALVICGFTGLAVGVLIRFILLAGLKTTPGRMIAGLRVVEKTGKPLGGGRALGRTLIETIEMIPAFGIPILSLVSLLMVKPDQKKGSFADTATGTLVVKSAEWKQRLQTSAKAIQGKSVTGNMEEPSRKVS